jgi:hypothetical protein
MSTVRPITPDEANKKRFLEQVGNGKLKKVRVTTTIEFID